MIRNCWFCEYNKLCISIAEKPKFITGLLEDTVEDGGETELMVRADGLPKPEIKWFFNAQPLIEDENHKSETHTETQVTSCLRIKNYNKDDVGFVSTYPTSTFFYFHSSY